MTKVFLLIRYVPERLPVIADEVDIRFADSCMAAELAPRLAVKLAQKKVHTAEIRRRGAAAACKAQYLRADFGRKRNEHKIALLHARCRAVPIYFGKDSIYTVGTCAGHEADDEAGRLVYKRFYRVLHISPRLAAQRGRYWFKVYYAEQFLSTDGMYGRRRT